MKKIYTLLLFLFFHSYFCFSQTPDGDNNKKVEVIKMGYMTKDLNLTEEEAKSFWPVYNSYVNEIKQARNQYPNDEVAFEKRVVEIKERYQGNFKKVLGNNSQRANKVYSSEKQFNNALRNEQKMRQQNRAQPNQQPEQKQQKPQKQSQQMQKDRTNNPSNGNNNKKDNKIKKQSNPGKPNSRF